jgi:hypothetical protein
VTSPGSATGWCFAIPSLRIDSVVGGRESRLSRVRRPTLKFRRPSPPFSRTRAGTYRSRPVDNAIQTAQRSRPHDSSRLAQRAGIISRLACFIVRAGIRKDRRRTPRMVGLEALQRRFLDEPAMRRSLPVGSFPVFNSPEAVCHPRSLKPPKESKRTCRQSPPNPGKMPRRH